MVLPPSPERYEKIAGKQTLIPWCDTAKRSCDAWSHDPVTVYWSSGDIDIAFQTVELVDAIPLKYAAEIRQRMTALALSPAGKRNLRFRVKPKIEIGQEATKIKTVPTPGELDRRARLRVVG